MQYKASQEYVVFFVYVAWFCNNSNAGSWRCSLTGKQSNYFSVWSIFHCDCV